ncbi:hypothetical protein QIA17_03625 [Borreliella californiensis]|uniref:Uncharacterized protein n=1 Tax=Borreliella californiensis TaxID=373543 RepID=A0A7X0DP13_9SPIR|nr:hypothetical protein [Borreliella californiensis]MBB6212731.1 hypothetical protein [Borreliella californiensis]WKC91882.1 hypothetical protein QIA17_03625 [Borreliella californiensis]WNY70634.1 hypothetical protein QIA39_03090 [Borreliella californiensis]
MRQADFFVKKCKKNILNNNDLHSLINNIKNIFYEILKEFDRKSLENIFNYYYEVHDLNNSLYSFIEKFVPIINFLLFEDLEYNFNSAEKKLILNLFDLSANTLESGKLNRLAGALVSLKILN